MAPLTDAQRSASYRKRKAAQKQERRDHNNKLARERRRKKKEEAEATNESATNMMSDRENEDERPGVETPFELSTPPAGLLQLSSEKKVELLERSLIRSNKTASESISAIQHSMSAIKHTASESISKIGQIGKDDLQQEKEYRRLVLYGTPSRSTGSELSDEKLPSVPTPRPFRVMQPKATTSAPPTPSRSTTKSGTTSKSTPSKRKAPNTGSTARKSSTPRHSSRSAPKKTRTPRSSSSVKSTSTAKSISTKTSHCFPDIAPQFAMISKNEYKTTNVLDIGYDAGTWDFSISRHVQTILESDAAVAGCSVYLVGYRHEERTPVPGITDDHQRVNVPFFVAHVLPKNAPAPARIAVRNMEEHTLEYHSMSDLPLKWNKVATAPTGQDIFMLLSTARSTSRALSFHNETCTGGQFWFPNSSELEKDIKSNPGRTFTIDYNGDSFEFPEDILDSARSTIRNRLKESNTKWLNFCQWEMDRWLQLLLPAAVDAFFEYEEDLPREQLEEQVTEGLALAFRTFKMAQEKEVGLYAEHQWYEESLTHYKIYPENDFLKTYLSQDGTTDLNQWCGKAKSFFPFVAQKETNASKGLDIWGKKIGGSSPVPTNGLSPIVEEPAQAMNESH